MGNQLCCGRYQEEQDDLSVYHKYEIANKIIDFNWNHTTKEFTHITLEETLLRRLTNDLGQEINPQTTHIIFSEFK